MDIASYCAESMCLYPALRAVKQELRHWFVGLKYTPNPRRGILMDELGRARRSLMESLDAMLPSFKVLSIDGGEVHFPADGETLQNGP